MGGVFAVLSIHIQALASQVGVPIPALRPGIFVVH
jgi:hypothetical protein